MLRNVALLVVLVVAQLAQCTSEGIELMFVSPGRGDFGGQQGNNCCDLIEFVGATINDDINGFYLYNEELTRELGNGHPVFRCEEGNCMRITYSRFVLYYVAADGHGHQAEWMASLELGSSLGIAVAGLGEDSCPNDIAVGSWMQFNPRADFASAPEFDPAVHVACKEDGLMIHEDADATSPTSPFVVDPETSASRSTGMTSTATAVIGLGLFVMGLILAGGIAICYIQHLRRSMPLIMKDDYGAYSPPPVEMRPSRDVSNVV